MRREGTIGAAAIVTILAVLGISFQSGSKSGESGGPIQDRTSLRSKPPLPAGRKSRGQNNSHNGQSWCTGLQEELESFLSIDNIDSIDNSDLLVPPGKCYDPPQKDLPLAEQNRSRLTPRTSHLKFIVALMPDPVHTHLSVLFDQLAVAIQEGAQDENYEFDSSWLPWDDEQTSYPLLLDERNANREQQSKEDQPGIILFRRTEKPGNKNKPSNKSKPSNKNKPGDEENQSNCEALKESYCEGLVVFVVGEEATGGIHRNQFRNALAWIGALHPETAPDRTRLAILGPTFSGSIPSLMQLLSESDIAKSLGLNHSSENFPLTIYSGSVSNTQNAENLKLALNDPGIFHSFVQSDEEILKRFSRYMCTGQPECPRIAMLSEDETAYGGERFEKATRNGNSREPNPLLRLYYPRDISALRGAYQTNSLFAAQGSSQPADMRRQSLPTDLADPSGRVHDSIRSYGGNQTPLVQEAVLMEIVSELRDHHIQQILLRGSNTLDQLFLANFLRRSYPDGRIVIVSSDLMFIRDRGVTGLNGVMSLSTYPLFPLEQEWTQKPGIPAADRIFGGDVVEGTYIAFRLLLNDQRLTDDSDFVHCHVTEPLKTHPPSYTIFLPSVSCKGEPLPYYSPIPDYSFPFWMPKQAATATDLEDYQGPATWLSVIAVNRFWPAASLAAATTSGKNSPHESPGQSNPLSWTEMPIEMKVSLFLLVGFSLFHLWCCYSGSYTAKPAFLAHFVSQGEWRHTWLVFCGSCCIAALAFVSGLSSGMFSARSSELGYPWYVRALLILVLVSALAAVLINGYIIRKRSLGSSAWLAVMSNKGFFRWNCALFGLFVAAVALFYLLVIRPLEQALIPENEVWTYWRAMHLSSGVSPAVPFFCILLGLYLTFWFTLHGLALFGPDRPCLPPVSTLVIKDLEGQDSNVLRMFSQEDAGKDIEERALPLNWAVVGASIALALLFALLGLAITGGVPIYSWDAKNYSLIVFLGLDFCFTLAIVQVWRLYGLWIVLKRLLAFLDRLSLRRALAALRGFSWGSVWKMSGNVLEVRYKIISRQIECMNHTISSLEEAEGDPSCKNTHGIMPSLEALKKMREASLTFGKWFSKNYAKKEAEDLTSFRQFQESVAATSGTLLSQLLVPAWRSEEESLTLESSEGVLGKDDLSNKLTQAKEQHIRNAEEFVSLTYLGFVQNVLGRLRTMALITVLLFLACTLAVSTYPFDPRQGLSAVLIILFVILGAVIVKVYADMHRDSTLSRVTNTKPGELGAEFWFKIIGFGFAPLIGLITRIFPSIADFIFSWLQPSISSLK